MNATCPVCKQPCIPAELHAYGKCENCYNRVSESGIETFAPELRADLNRRYAKSDVPGLTIKEGSPDGPR